MRVYLKVKNKSLAEEARIIKLEEGRHTGLTRQGLYLHRINVVRPEARATLLADCFFRGKEYSEIEHKTYTPAYLMPWQKVKKMVESYCTNKERKSELDEWIKRANAHIKN